LCGSCISRVGRTLLSDKSLQAAKTAWGEPSSQVRRSNAPQAVWVGQSCRQDEQAEATASPRTHRVSQHTQSAASNCAIYPGFTHIPHGDPIANIPGVQGRTHMQLFITFITVVGGLIFSVAVAIVVEEFIFGQIFRMFFTPTKTSPAVPILARWIAQPIRANQGR
jgi:hypothetical protein